MPVKRMQLVVVWIEIKLIAIGQENIDDDHCLMLIALAAALC